MINPLNGFNPAVFLQEIILLYSRSENNFPQGKEFNVILKRRKSAPSPIQWKLIVEIEREREWKGILTFTFPVEAAFGFCSFVS